MDSVLPGVITARRLAIWPRHYKKDCPKLKNNNRGNQVGNGGATTRAYVVGNAGKTRMPMSFVSTAFSSLIDIVLTALDHDYDIELADGKIIEVSTIIRGCSLNFLNHPFNIDLIPIELGSFDVIIRMDWLIKYHAVIVCDEKIVRIPFENEILIVCGNGNNNGHESRYDVDKTEGEAIERNGNILASRFLLKYFRRIAGYYTNRQVEFHNPFDNWTVVPLALRRPYRLAPSRCKEFSNNCRELSAKDL
ncbi:putative reverse transcriptase domain-containing protein [Tanacetum coccineum]|uniref:Reverse transcriptase domain-containing protein n=1 Tax=Tanacetum coccineum TaxID=301880 RepID=A0ABQ5GRD5_9ASTR